MLANERTARECNQNIRRAPGGEGPRGHRGCSVPHRRGGLPHLAVHRCAEGKLMNAVLERAGKPFVEVVTILLGPLNPSIVYRLWIDSFSFPS